jgi:hypothetical protein
MVSGAGIRTERPSHCIFYDVSEKDVAVLAIVPESEAEAWPKEAGEKP